MRWGLIPDKVGDPETFKIFTTTNARAESILDRPIWKKPFNTSRCLIPLDRFYEWLQRPSLPQPPPIEPGEHGLFGDVPVPVNRTPKPKAGSKPVFHNRIPVILHPRDYERWPTDYDESRPPINLLRPYEAEGMSMTPANRLVGNVRNNGPEMLSIA